MTSLLQSIRYRFGFWQKLQYYRAFFKSATIKNGGRKEKILLYAGIPNMYLSAWEMLLYHLLRARGYEVDYVVYDAAVPMNELITQKAVETRGKDAYWNPLVKQGMQMLKAAGIQPKVIPFPLEEIGKLIPPLGSEPEAYFNFHFDGLHLGSHVHGVTFRYYKSTTFGPDAANVARKFLITTLANYLFIRDLCQKSRYHSVLFSHGIYCTWGSLTDYCLKYKVPFVCYDRAKTKGTLNFNYNQPAPVWSFDSAWNRYNNRKLNELENAKVDEYFRERELQKGDVFAYNFTPRQSDVAALKINLGIPEGRKVITLFSNLIWDAANVSRDIAFPSALDCIVRTIEHFAGREDVQIVLRAHPAEKVLGTSQTYKGLVSEHFDHKLPSNFTFLDYEVNSYNVLDLSDIGVVNTSTVGLEFAMTGKPILLISETHYRGKGFTYDSSSEEQYFQLLEELIISPELLPAQVELARKYYYMMMYLYQQRMPLEYSGTSFLKYEAENFEALYRDNPTLSRILSAIESGREDFVFWGEEIRDHA
jgi:CDP-glycerol glycerophosphotransferase (TagB/SpsB family)